jgi:SAM-dependent methyltransferase
VRGAHVAAYRRFEMTSAAAHWRNSLAAWAIPESILAAAPESPWGFPEGHHAAPETPADSPSRRFALAALPPNGTVLDVGCGGGAASLALVPGVGSIIGVDERAGALVELAAACAERGVACASVLGSWPGVAGRVATADVVVCHHVAYNVADLPGFAEALTTHARRQVVLELGATHPLTPLAPLWRHFWNLGRPSGPSAADALAVIQELGIEPEVAIHDRPRTGWATPAQEVAFVRKRLCLPSSRDAEVAEQLARHSVPSNEVWTLAWPGQA